MKISRISYQKVYHPDHTKDKLGADRAGRERGREMEEDHRDGRGTRLDGPPGDRSLDRGKRSAEREFGRERRRSTSVSPGKKDGGHKRKHLIVN